MGFEKSPELVAGGDSTLAAVGVSQRSDAERQSQGVSGGCQLRPRVGGSLWFRRFLNLGYVTSRCGISEPLSLCYPSGARW